MSDQKKIVWDQNKCWTKKEKIIGQKKRKNCVGQKNVGSKKNIGQKKKKLSDQK